MWEIELDHLKGVIELQDFIGNNRSMQRVESQNYWVGQKV